MVWRHGSRGSCPNLPYRIGHSSNCFVEWNEIPKFCIGE
jgi:hypothetical protein